MKQMIASGTFDLLHNGHKSFLKKSLEIGDEIIVCITSDSYVKSFKEGRDIESFELRRSSVAEFLESIGAKGRTRIVSIDDIYGPLLTDEYNPQGIAVTPENEKTGLLINSERTKKGLEELEIKVIEMEKAEDGEVISSSRIRSGMIDREGKLYVDPKWKDRKLILPRDLRGELAKPFGKVLNFAPNHIDPDKTIAIGDVTTKMFNEKNLTHKLSVIDFVVKREKKFDQLSQLGFDERIETRIVENAAGEIRWELFESIKNALFDGERSVILVNGEEDLAVLPAILAAPLGFKIYYGQPDRGLIEILVTEEKKKETKGLVEKFELSQTSLIS